MRSLHDHARVIGSDATTFIIITMCRSTSRHCLTIRMSYSACCGRWCLSCKPRTRSCCCWSSVCCAIGLARVPRSSPSISCGLAWRMRSKALRKTKPPVTQRRHRNDDDAPSRPTAIAARCRHTCRFEVIIDVDSKQCPCCGGALHMIGEDRTEQLDIVPAQLRVKVLCRPRYGCRGCEGAVVQAPAPERPIDGGMATEALIAHVVVSKFCDSLPLYRQAQMLKRQGITLDRSTLSTWVGRACWWLKPLYELVVSTVLSTDKVFADETTLPVLEPGRGKTKTGRLWCYAVDDRPWTGATHPAAAYVYSEDRRGEHPTTHLAAFRGTLQVDGYAGFSNLVAARRDASLRLAFCWAHARRPFYEFYTSNQSPLAAEVLARIAKLYEIEAGIRGQPPDVRKAVRQLRSRPLVEDLPAWLQEHVPRVPGWTDLAKAMRYVLRHWDGLILYLDDGRLEMDTNVVERAIRPVTITRKNSLFAGSDAGARRWAIANTLIQTCKLNGIEPLAWLTDILQRIVSGRTKNHVLHSLLPWNWRPPSTIAAA